MQVYPNKIVIAIRIIIKQWPDLGLFGRIYPLKNLKQNLFNHSISLFLILLKKINQSNLQESNSIWKLHNKNPRESKILSKCSLTKIPLSMIKILQMKRIASNNHKSIFIKSDQKLQEFHLKKLKQKCPTKHCKISKIIILKAFWITKQK